MATTITNTETLVGKRIRRREDPRLITGTATYVEDIKIPGMHYAVIVRSPHAAAKIRSIDTSKAVAHARACSRCCHRARYRARGAGTLRCLAAGAARAASSYIGYGSGVLRGSSSGRGCCLRSLHRE